MSIYARIGPVRCFGGHRGGKPGVRARNIFVYLLRHLFKTGKLDFAEPVAEGKARRHRVGAEVRGKIRAWRQRRLSAGEIAQLLSEDGVEISVFSQLPQPPT